MEDIWELGKLALFIAFVIPGFISLKTYELRCPRESKSSSEQVVDAIAYSSLNYALFLWAICLVELGKVWKTHPALYVLFYVVVLLIGPVVWPLLWFKLRKTRLVQYFIPHHPTRKPWDWLFEQKMPYWVIVYLKDGRKVGGLYSSKSFSSSAPEAEQIYLEQAYLINDDGCLERPLIGTAGVLAVGDISVVELFHLDGGLDDEQGQGRQPGTSPRGLPAPEGLSAPETTAEQPARGLSAREGPKPDPRHTA